MQPIEVYVRTDLELDEFARSFRQVLNIPETNGVSAAPQLRDGANFGGAYYLFEVLGIELILLVNSGEVAIPERGDYQFYVLVRSGDEEVETVVANHVKGELIRSGFDAEVDSLSA